MGEEQAFPFYEDRILRIPPEAAPATSKAVVASMYPDFRRRNGAPYGQDIVAYESDDAEAICDVIITGVPASNAGARLSECSPGGPGEGIKSGVVGGGSRPSSGMADTVLIHGAPTVRDTTEFEMNTAGPDGAHNTVGTMVYEGVGATQDRGRLYGAANATADAAMAPGLFVRTKYDLAAWRAQSFLQAHEPLLEYVPDPVLDAVSLAPIRDFLGVDHLIDDLAALSNHPIYGELLPSADRGEAYVRGVASLFGGFQDRPGETAKDLILAGYDERVEDGRPLEAQGYLGAQVLMTLAGARQLRGKVPTKAKPPTAAEPPVAVRPDTGVKVTRPADVVAMDSAGIKPDDYVYRVVDRRHLEFLSERHGLSPGHDQPTAVVRDVHSPYEVPDYAIGLDDFGMHVFANEVQAHRLSNPYGWNLARSKSAVAGYAGPDSVVIRIRVADIIAADGRWYPDSKAAITGGGAVYVTAPRGTKLPFEVVP